jgi:hypothetical protein
MGTVHESSHFGHAVELVILVHEKLLRHFDPDIAAKRAQVSLRIVQEHACQGTGRNADGASKRVEVEGLRVVRAEEGEDLRAAPTECKGSRGGRIVFARLREQGDPVNQRSEVDRAREEAVYVKPRQVIGDSGVFCRADHDDLAVWRARRHCAYRKGGIQVAVREVSDDQAQGLSSELRQPFGCGDACFSLESGSEANGDDGRDARVTTDGE